MSSESRAGGLTGQQARRPSTSRGGRVVAPSRSAARRLAASGLGPLRPATRDVLPPRWHDRGAELHEVGEHHQDRSHRRHRSLCRRSRNRHVEEHPRNERCRRKRREHLGRRDPSRTVDRTQRQAEGNEGRETGPSAFRDTVSRPRFPPCGRPASGSGRSHRSGARPQPRPSDAVLRGWVGVSQKRE